MLYQMVPRIQIPSPGLNRNRNIDTILTHGFCANQMKKRYYGGQVYLIRSRDYMVTVVAVIAAVIVYKLYWFFAK